MFFKNSSSCSPRTNGFQKVHTSHMQINNDCSGLFQPPVLSSVDECVGHTANGLHLLCNPPQIVLGVLFIEYRRSTDRCGVRSELTKNIVTQSVGDASQCAPRD